VGSTNKGGVLFKKEKNMSRSNWKNLKIVQKKFCNSSNIIKIWGRGATITSIFIGKIVFIYNGKIFKKINITREKVGYKYGEFSGTRNYKNVQKKSIKILKK
jgi:small subunit ribosomal protein S19